MRHATPRSIRPPSSQRPLAERFSLLAAYEKFYTKLAKLLAK
jgi:hypothetical protein